MKFKKLIPFLLLVILVVVATGFSFGKKKKIDPIYITKEELSQYNGEEGRPMYVAVDGKIYDVTKCKYWKKGVHTKSPDNALAGFDLTEVLKESEHGLKRVKRYPIVGYLIESKETKE